MVVIQELLEANHALWYSNFAWRPAHLFDNVSRALTIFVAHKSETHQCYSTSYIKWRADTREFIFPNLSYIAFNDIRKSFWMPKFKSTIENSILFKILSSTCNVDEIKASKGSQFRVFYRTTGGVYWKTITTWSPKFTCNGIEMKSSRETSLEFENQKIANVMAAILGSDIFWWWYTVTSNLRDLNPSDISGFRFPSSCLSDNSLIDLSSRFMQDLDKKSIMQIRMQKTKGETKTQLFKVSQSKPIIDLIDKTLSQHYGFSDEEIDFIINYDIKYRMSDELNSEEQ
jgi:hypothetical protein